MRRLTTFFLAMLSAMQIVIAQTEYFNYSDEGKTIISGVNEYGIGAILNDNIGILTIPATVMRVNHNAFSSVKQNIGDNVVFDIVIDEGGNPEFLIEDQNHINALASVNGNLAGITIKGNSMTTENIGKMLEGLGGKGALKKIDIYNTEFPLDAQITSANIDANVAGVRVVLPAARVGSVDNQIIGSSNIYGRFTLNSELSTFCGNCLFQDIDVGSNFLFYIPTEINVPSDISGYTGSDKMIYIQRVKYILPNQGVLMHKENDTSSKVELPRVKEDDITSDQYNTDKELYKSNMLVGVTEPTNISGTEDKGGDTYINMILYQGTFYPTSGGTLGANRAYLQVKQSDLGSQSQLPMRIVKPGEATNIKKPEPQVADGNVWYSISGQRVEGTPCRPGIYIYQGKKVKL